jgi:YgiT-type zinc finger domain-containing protein
MAASEPESRAGYICPKCLTGTMQLRRVAFAHWYGGQFITIPSFPGWVCDVCGEREYDSVALDQVETVLGTELDLRREAGRRARRGTPRAIPLHPPSGRRLS